MNLKPIQALPHPGHWALVFALIGLTLGPGKSSAADEHPFSPTQPHQLHLEISADGLRSLRNQSREWVRATWSDGHQLLTNIGVRVKGRIGSFRPVDDKPSLTIDFDQYVAGQHWCGLRRVHLNNSVEDPSYQHEKLGGGLFRAAGIPAPQVTHGVVTLNSRRLGLYVIKEGFTGEFLQRHYSDAIGNLYEPDPGPGCDVDGPMNLNLGPGPTNRADLHFLFAAASEPDPALRWNRLGQVLNVDRFVTFLAMETLVGHRDGYGQARNNYRLYHDPATSRFEFIPSGLDRLFARPDATLVPRFSGLVAEAVMATDEGRTAYHARLGTLFTNHFQRATLHDAVVSNTAALSPTLRRSEARSIRRAGTDLVDRIQRRIEFVGRQLAESPPAPLRFTNQIATLNRWQPVDPPEHGRLHRVVLDGRVCLVIVAGPRTAASWRTRVRLDPGRYRFEARVRTLNVAPLPFGKHHGAALTANGRIGRGTHWLLGQTDWTVVGTEFEIPPGEPEADLSCALRASSGEAWFDESTIRIVRLE